jgi:hypothetical protein
MKKISGLTFYSESYSPVMDQKFHGLKAAFSAPPIPSALPTLQIGIPYAVNDAFVESLGWKNPAELRSESEYYVTISMGSLLSNTLRIHRGNPELGPES